VGKDWYHLRELHELTLVNTWSSHFALLAEALFHIVPASCVTCILWIKTSSPSHMPLKAPCTNSLGICRWVFSPGLNLEHRSYQAKSVTCGEYFLHRYTNSVFAPMHVMKNIFLVSFEKRMRRYVGLQKLDSYSK